MCRSRAVAGEPSPSAAIAAIIAARDPHDVRARIVREASGSSAVSLAHADRSAGILPCRRSVSQAAGATTDRRTTRRVGTDDSICGECSGTGAGGVCTQLSASSNLGARCRLNGRGSPIFAGACRVHAAKHLPGMAPTAPLRRAITAVQADLSATHFGEPRQALAVLHRRRAADGAAQYQPMQGRSTTCLEIWLVPHVRHGQTRAPTMQVHGVHSQSPSPPAASSRGSQDLCNERCPNAFRFHIV